MYKVKVYVTLRESILDPQGAAVKGGLHRLGFTEVGDVRIGKMIELVIDGNTPRADLDVCIREMCDKLLVNEVMEDYCYEIEELP